MSLAAGTKLGPCEILAVLGAGGSGALYRARHSKLGSSLAPKAFQKRWRKSSRTTGAESSPANHLSPIGNERPGAGPGHRGKQMPQLRGPL
jgi:hypothetical protein